MNKINEKLSKKELDLLKLNEEIINIENKLEELIIKKETKKVKEDKLKKENKIEKLKDKQKIILEEIKELKNIEDNNIVKEKENKNKYEKLINEIINKEVINISIKPILKIIEEGRIIKKIIHMADIHIRLDKMFEEYNKVFNRLYENLNNIKENDTIIVICGDLLNSKDILKPDTIKQTWNFLNKLSEYFDVFIIAGNHDVVENNLNKTDTISAILLGTMNKRINYLKDSGVYIYNNIIFGVSSINDKYILKLDELNNILNENNIQINKNTKKIGLYHGSVVGSIMSNNKLVEESKSINLAIFGEYDYLLLGDIHKHQYLRKNVAYPSSLIAQNFGECDDNHGYIEWDILIGDSKFEKIINEHSYYKVNIENIIKIENDIINIDYIELEKYIGNNKSGYLRIDYNDKYEISKLVSEIKKNYPEFIITENLLYDDLIDMNIVNKNEEKDILLGNISIDDMIRNYMRINFTEETEETIEKTLKYIKLLEKKINPIKKIDYVNSDWKILFLSFDNMFGYGIGNNIDFSKFPINNIVGIIGDNACGKSSLLDIIVFMLYSKTAKDKFIPKDIINIYEETAKGTIIIESNNTKYMIKKTCYKHKEDIEHKLKLYKMIESFDNDKNINEILGSKYLLYDISEQDRKLTETIIESLIGTYDNFLTSCLLPQGIDNSFKVKNSNEKIKFLITILKINYLTNINKYVTKSQYLLINSNNEKNQKINKKKSIEDIKKDNILLEDIINLKKENLVILNENLNKNMIILINLKKDIIIFDKLSKIKNNEDLIKNKEIINREKQKIEKNLELIKNNKENILNLDLSKNESDKLKYYKTLLKELKFINSKELIIKNHIENEKKVKEIRKEINNLLLKKSNLKIKDIFIQNIEIYLKENLILLENKDIIEKDYNDYILSNTNIIYSKLNEIKNEINIKENIDIILNSLDILLNKTNKKHIIVEKYEKLNIVSICEIDQLIKNKQFELDSINDNEYIELQKEINLEIVYQKDIDFILIKIEKDILENNNNILELEKEIYNSNEYIKNIVNDINLYINIQDSLEKNEIIKKNILEHDIINNNITKNIYEIKNKLDIEEKLLFNNNRDILELSELNDEVDENNKRLKFIKIIVKITNLKGLPIYILKNYFNIINFKINSILEEFINKKINLKLNSANKLEIEILTDNKKINTLSGMESLMLDIVFKIIISQITLLPKANILFLDESLNVLDKNRIEEIHIYFNLLNKYFNNTFIITHNHQIRSHINYHLNIIKRDNNQSLIYNNKENINKKLLINIEKTNILFKDKKENIDDDELNKLFGNNFYWDENIDDDNDINYNDLFNLEEKKKN